MPKVFVITDQRDLAALASQLLTSRTRAATRVAALDALRRANPALNLDRLSPGTVVIIPPEVPGMRPAAGSDPAGEALDDLTARVGEGLTALREGFDTAGERRHVERDLANALFDSEVVQRLAHGDRLLGENIAAVVHTLDADEAQADEQRAALDEAIAEWGNDLEALRKLL